MDLSNAKSKLFSTITIAIDAYTLSVPLAGIGRYTQQLLLKIVRARDINSPQIIIYTAAPITPKQWETLGFTEEDLSKIININFKLGNWCLPNVTKINSPILKILQKIVAHIWAYFGIALLLKKNPPHIFFSTMHHLPVFVPKSTKAVFTIHDLILFKMPSAMDPVNRLAEKFFLPRAVKTADLIFSVTQSTESDLYKYFPSAKHKSVLLYSGVSTNITNINFSWIEFAQRMGSEQINITSEVPRYILFVGTLEPRKNLKNLLLAFNLLDENIKSKTFLFIIGAKGWGEGINKIIATFAKPTQTQIKVLGYVSDSDLGGLYQNCLFLAMPSLYEGYGFPLVEAMLANKAVLTSNFGATAEIAGKCGLLINPEDVESIKQGISTLITNDKLREELANNCSTNLQKYSWDKTLKTWINHIEKLLQ